MQHASPQLWVLILLILLFQVHLHFIHFYLFLSIVPISCFFSQVVCGIHCDRPVWPWSRKRHSNWTNKRKESGALSTPHNYRYHIIPGVLLSLNKTARRQRINIETRQKYVKWNGRMITRTGAWWEERRGGEQEKDKEEEEGVVWSVANRFWRAALCSCCWTSLIWSWS